MSSTFGVALRPRFSVSDERKLLLGGGDELVEPGASTDPLNGIDPSNLCQECGGWVLATDPVAVGNHKLKPLFVVDDVSS